MTDIEPLPARVERIEQKLDALSNSVDRQFDEVSEQFVEQGKYTEFAVDRLRGEMVAGFARLEGLIAANTRGLGRVERKLDQFIAAYEPPSRRGPRPPKKQTRR